MIGIIFTLTGLVLFMLMILITDASIALKKEVHEINAAFGFDTDIFPDHEP